MATPQETLQLAPTTNDFVLQGNAVFIADDDLHESLCPLAAVPVVVEPGVRVTFKMPPRTRVVKTDCTVFLTREVARDKEFTVDMRSIAVCEQDIELVMAQVAPDYDDDLAEDVVVNALLAHKGDIVEAIMELTCFPEAAVGHDHDTRRKDRTTVDMQNFEEDTSEWCDHDMPGYECAQCQTPK